MFCNQGIGRAVCWSLLLLLAACGGGGGGGDNGGSGNTAPVGGSQGGSQNGLVITSSKSELRFIRVGDAPAAFDQITFSLAGATASAVYYAKAESDISPGFGTQIIDSNLTSITVGVNAYNMPASADGSIHFKLCKDEKCNEVVWSRSIPYRVRTYRFDTSEVALSGFEGATATVTKAITPAALAGDLLVESNQPWLSGNIDKAGQLVIAASGAGLREGNHVGGLSILPMSGQGQGTAIRVVLTLGTGVALPADGMLTIGNGTPGLVNKSMNLTFNGQQAPVWSVTSDKPWLVPLVASGTGAATVAYTIDTTKLTSLENFGAETGKLTFRIAGNSNAVYNVVVDKKLAQIQAVMPRQVVAGQSAQIRLRGRGLQQLASVGAITLDGVALTTGAIISDNEVSVTVAGMSAGAHVFDIPGSAGVSRQAIDAVNAPQLSAAIFDSAGDKWALVYSAKRNAIYTLDQTNAKLLRYVLTNGSWRLDRAIPAVSTARLGLAHDENTLYTTSGGYTLEERDPETLAIRASHVYDGMDPYMSNYRGSELPITSDGRIWFARDQWSTMLYFDTATKTFGAAEVRNGDDVHNPVYAVSADGSRMFVYSATGLGNSALRYDITTGKLGRINTLNFGNVGTELSGDGKYVLIGATDMYESDTARFVGKLPAGTGGYYQQALVSRDGSRIYTTVSKYEFGVSSLIRLDVIDAVSMTKLGTIALPDGVVDCSAGAWNCNPNGVLKLSPFGDAIIWAGNKKIAILPVPKALGSIGAARFKLVR